MPTYTFRCPNGHEFDARVSRDTYQVTSDSRCGCVATAKRESVYAVNFGGFARTPPSEKDWSRQYKDFSEASQEVAYASERRGVAPPPLARMAKRRASELHAKGVTLDDL